MNCRSLSRHIGLGSLSLVVLTVLVNGSGLAEPPARAEDIQVRGRLVICGGGELPAEVRARIIELAGGPKARFLVIPTASSLAETDPPESWLQPWKAAGVESPTLFHTRSREQANDPGFTQPLDQATAVWISGGDQSKLTEVYLGTLVEKKLEELLVRGGLIGGTSAGAACMTRVMITGGRETATLGRGFDFLPGAIVDQHFLRRNRFGRLLGALSEKPELIGLGIDESTAAIVQPGKLEVAGRSYVLVIRSQGAGKPARVDAFHKGESIAWPPQAVSSPTAPAAVKP
mgnify:CR=1 FL=1